jgi:fructose-1,6-bisphosphatase/inositol monophosphatase family enzyme
MSQSLARLSAEVFNVRMLGTTVRVLTYLAEGVIDASVEYHDMPWDFAGSIPIIKEAGASICDISGKHFTPDSRGYIASAPGVFDEVVRLTLGRELGIGNGD